MHDTVFRASASFERPNIRNSRRLDSQKEGGDEKRKRAPWYTHLIVFRNNVESESARLCARALARPVINKERKKYH